MRDFLDWRKVFCAITPSINNCVQPEYDAMRSLGVANQTARMQGSDVPIRPDADLERAVYDLLASLGEAIDQVWPAGPATIIRRNS